MSTLLQPEQRVLSTLEADGSRRWLTPKLSKGRFWQWRRVVAYLLIAIYALAPFVTINGRPAILLDLISRQFTILGVTFLPTDSVLLSLLLVLVAVTIFAATALAGRVWCGWACPQTVYMEFVFRPLERLFTGRTGKGGPPAAVAAWRTIAFYASSLIVCWHLANMFLAYFVGAHRLHAWIWSAAPWEHPGPFAVVLFLTALMMFDFCYWREQLCIIGCPYGRFQSVMLDRNSAIIGYDEARGEPRGKGREREAAGLGDCIDCNQCVVVCPTGIDIRAGLQMECIGCAQCIDACDAVMDKINRPRGLVRYSSQAAMAKEPVRLLRPRVVLYTGLMALLLVAMGVVIVSQRAFDVVPLRGLGLPFTLTATGDVENVIRLRIVNRTDAPATYSLAGVSPATLRITSVQANISAGPRETVMEPVHLVIPQADFGPGVLDVVLRVTNQTADSRDIPFRMLGPTSLKPRLPQ